VQGLLAEYNSDIDTITTAYLDNRRYSIAVVILCIIC